MRIKAQKKKERGHTKYVFLSQAKRGSRKKKKLPLMFGCGADILELELELELWIGDSERGAFLFAWF